MNRPSMEIVYGTTMYLEAIASDAGLPNVKSVGAERAGFITFLSPGSVFLVTSKGGPFCSKFLKVVSCQCFFYEELVGRIHTAQEEPPFRK